jgi:uncharacterized protein involved in response to NO
MTSGVRVVTHNDPQRTPRFVPFGHGFRPFFLAALAYASVGLATWLWMRATGSHPLPPLPSQLWHAHEMLFGFIAAAIAGFLLTAVPSWTGTRGIAGLPLITLTLVWVAGRLSFAAAADVPLRMIAAVELSFIPFLAALIAPPLLRARNRNTALLGVLAVLWLVDGFFLCAMSQGDIELASRAIRAGLDLVLLLITVIGGRIVPSFTGNALRQQGLAVKVRTWPWVEGPLVAAMIMIVAIDVFAPEHPYAWGVFGLAALGHAVRLAGWQGLRTSRQPILWVLHVAYAWLPIGLTLRAFFAFNGSSWAAEWLHALTMGASGMMVVAVMTRASLGHTGRPLQVTRAVAIAYAALACAVLVRTFGPIAMEREASIRTSGMLWLSAFLVLLIVYFPALTQARVDGRPG